MYPDCPYHDAWNPAIPLGTLAGGAMPGPIEPTHVAFAGAGAGADAGAAAASDAMSMSTPMIGAITRPTLRLACRDGNATRVAAIGWQACPMRRRALC